MSFTIRNTLEIILRWQNELRIFVWGVNQFDRRIFLPYEDDLTYSALTKLGKTRQTLSSSELF